MGLPIGNLTSQLFANIYLNELDWFVRHKLKIKNYLRYTDDFIIIHNDRQYLESLIPQIEYFLNNELKLDLHPEKVIIRKWRQGIDFLGYVSLPYHRVLRTKTKRRMFKKIGDKVDEYHFGEIPRKSLRQTANSYLGMLQHCCGYKLKRKLVKMVCRG